MNQYDLAETVGEDSVLQPFSVVLHFSERTSIEKIQKINIFHVILQYIILISWSPFTLPENSLHNY